MLSSESSEKVLEPDKFESLLSRRKLFHTYRWCSPSFATRTSPKAVRGIYSCRDHCSPGTWSTTHRRLLFYGDRAREILRLWEEVERKKNFINFPFIQGQPYSIGICEYRVVQISWLKETASENLEWSQSFFFVVGSNWWNTNLPELNEGGHSLSTRVSKK